MGIREFLTDTPIYDWFGKRSFAQSGEDIVVDGELGKPKKGFYVDVGAYHPKLFSNTYLFYKRGWSGVCIEPNPTMSAKFSRIRPRDAFVNMGVSSVEDVLEYFEFNDGAANTFLAEQAKKNQKEAGRKLLRKRSIEVWPLKKILAKHVKSGTTIDLMSVDVEGMDVQVLESNDWEMYRPKMIIAEDLDFDFRDWKKSRLAKYLDGKGYFLCAKTPYSLIFRDKKTLLG